MDEPDPPCGGETEQYVCPDCGGDASLVPTVTLYHLLDPFQVRGISPEQSYAVCRERNCPVLYFSSDHEQTWKTSDVRTPVGFKRSPDEPPHSICYCFEYTRENIAREIEETGESTAVEWITERVQAGECACKYKNPTGRCCLKAVEQCVEEFTP